MPRNQKIESRKLVPKVPKVGTEIFTLSSCPYCAYHKGDRGVLVTIREIPNRLRAKDLALYGVAFYKYRSAGHDLGGLCLVGHGRWLRRDEFGVLKPQKALKVLGIGPIHINKIRYEVKVY